MTTAQPTDAQLLAFADAFEGAGHHSARLADCLGLAPLIDAGLLELGSTTFAPRANGRPVPATVTVQVITTTPAGRQVIAGLAVRVAVERARVETERRATYLAKIGKALETATPEQVRIALAHGQVAKVSDLADHPSRLLFRVAQALGV